MVAALNGFIETVELLINYGADIYSTSYENKTAEDYAQSAIEWLETNGSWSIESAENVKAKKNATSECLELLRKVALKK